MDRYETAIKKIKEALFDIVSLSLDSNNLNINELVMDADKLIEDIEVLSGKKEQVVIPIDVEEDKKSEEKNVLETQPENKLQQIEKEEPILEVKEEKEKPVLEVKEEKEEPTLDFTWKEEKQPVTFIKENNIQPHAILVTKNQFSNLKKSHDTMLATNKYKDIIEGQVELEEVDVKTKIEKLMEEASLEYQKGNTIRAEEIYNEVSKLNQGV
jgi:hypothetical protein